MFVKKDNEEIVAGPLGMVRLPPRYPPLSLTALRHYCIVKNPVVRNEKGQVWLDTLSFNTNFR